MWGIIIQDSWAIMGLHAGGWRQPPPRYMFRHAKGCTRYGIRIIWEDAAREAHLKCSGGRCCVCRIMGGGGDRSVGWLVILIIVAVRC